MKVRLLIFALVAAALVAALFAQSGSREVSVIVTNGIVVTMNPARQVIQNGAVAIDGTDIVAVGPTPDITARFRARERVDAAGEIVLPGLINTHTHAPMVLFRGLADDLALSEWLEKYIFPAEAKTVSPEFVRAGTRLAALEMIESGTTTYADMYYFEEEIAKETKAAGLRGVLGQTIIQFPVADAKAPADALARAEKFITAFKNDSLITPAVAPHAIYTLDAASLRAARDLSRRHNVPTLIHLAETQDEAKNSETQFKLSPVGYLESLGFLGPGVLAAHGVWVTEPDIALLTMRHVGISHNPESNMKLASGTAPVPAYLRADAAIGLGTDGAASNNDLDMFEAMRMASLLHKLQSADPRAVSAKTALEMATIRGARALGMEKEIGSLEAGKRADAILVRVDRPHAVPLYDAVSQMVYALKAGDVRDVMVNGKAVVRDGRILTLNQQLVLQKAEEYRLKISASLK